MADLVTGSVGIVIGLPGLVLTCVQYYDAVQSYLNSKKEFAAYIPLLGWEYQRFLDWKRQAMPDGHNLLIDEPAIENLTIACLDQIKITFQDAENQSGKYGMRKLLDWSTRRTVLKDEIHDVSRLRRVAWALEGSRAAEKLRAKLKNYNDALDSIWRRSRASVARRLLPELDDINSVSGLRLIEESLKREEDEEYLQLASAIRFRRECLEVKLRSKASSSAQGPTGETYQSRTLKLKHEDFPENYFKTARPKKITVVKGKHVLVEWKHYAREAPPSIAKRAYNDEVSENVRELAYVLAEGSKPWRLRALDCVGFYERPEEGPFIQVCFAMELPENIKSEPVSLSSILEKAQTYEQGRLHLGDQFILAQVLASALYQLHFAGWLHKGIRSSNICFFKPNPAPQDWSISPKDAYLTGYEFSRMIDSTSLSSKPGVTPDSARYTHPKYWGHVDARFEALYDIYSLGIVLIEIALWKTTKTMAEKLNRDPTRTEISLAEWRDAVEKDLIPEVERRAGRIYGDVVRRCVTGDFGDAACRSDVGRLLKAFDREVVAKLEKCYA